MNKKTLNDYNFENKKVIVRVDFNVPIQNGIVTDVKRIKEALKTIQYLVDKNAKIILLSHLGRIESEEDKNKNTLRLVYEQFKKMTKFNITFIDKNIGKEVEEAVNNLKPKQILMLENTRFQDVIDNKVVNLESKNDKELGKYWASLGDIFVNDAFGTAHRAHASNVGIAKNIKEGSCLGFLVENEMTMLSKAITEPKRPLIAILGGAKISDKIKVIDRFLEIADKVIIVGGMTYTFMKSVNKEIGTSIVEIDKLDLAKKYLEKGKGKLIFPIDFATTNEFKDVKPIYTNNDVEIEQILSALKNNKTMIDFISEISKDMMALDIGPKSIELINKILEDAKTIIWNGPAGVFEFEHYALGTKEICKTISKLKDVFSVIGGGDSAAAAIKLGYEDKFSHISTGGGASLEFFEGKILPGIDAISDK